MKLLIVDDHPLVRRGISSALFLEKEVDQVLEASNIEEAINLIDMEEPELSIVDLYLGDESGLDLIKRAKSNGVSSRFVILTSSSKKEDFQKSVEVGVDGYILKEAYIEDILYAISIVMRGKKFIDSELVRYQMDSSSKEDYMKDLTPREKDVLLELAKGLSNADIGSQLFISECTVKKHVSNILSKLNLERRIEAAILVNNTERQ